MAQKERYYRWEWVLESSPQAIWPFFADTNRLNKDTGLFPVDEVDRRQDERLGNARRKLRYRLPLPFLYVDYQEEPFEWTYPYRYGVIRQFKNAPISTFRIEADFKPLPEGGTHLTYQVWVQPKGILGVVAAAVALGLIAPRRFEKAIRAYDKMATSDVPAYIPQKPSFSSGGRARVQQIEIDLINEGLNPELVARLINLVRTADDLTLSRIRPYVYADLWGTERRAVLELFLWATRVGLLDFQWEVLCPMCRGAEDRVSSQLSEVSAQAHCHTCNIDFDSNFENSVELTFTPNPAIRYVPRMEFCVAGPEITPHIIVQQLLPPLDERLVIPMLDPGRYRIRSMSLPGGLHFRVEEDAVPELQISADRDGWPVSEPAIHTQPNLLLRNGTEEDQLFILERTSWSDQATTAAEVIALQRFRDLFANEALRPGEQIGVGHLTILFTDLVDSTRMYREIGDAPAFGVVMNHFDVLKLVIDEEEGAIVKTIGDAVMAVFRRPVSAVAAMVKAQSVLAVPVEGRRPLGLKAAIHTGPSIAVTLNERLDYFGTTINIASRLEKFAQGDDIILSDNTYADAEVQTFLSDPYEQFTVEPFEEMLKGFDDKCFKLWRVNHQSR